MIKDQTILLLHGANSVGNEWVNFENEFKKLGNKVVKPILRYHRLGFDGPEELGNTSIFDYVADIEETIKKLEQKPESHLFFPSQVEREGEKNYYHFLS